MTLGIFLLAGCRHKDDPQEDDITPIPQEILEISPKEINCAYSGGEFFIEIASSGNWAMEDTLSWVEVSKIDTENAKLVVAQNTVQEREGTISFMLGDLCEELTITQTASSSFTIDCSSKHFSHEGGAFTVKVKSYTPYDIETNNDWISTDIKSGSAPQDIKVNIKEHEGRTDRNGTLSFIKGDDTLSIMISQDAAPFIELSTESVSTDGDGGTFDILFMSNTTVDITCSHEWIRLIQVGTNNKVSFEVLRNMSEAREGNIIISATKHKETSKSLIIKQGEKIPHPAITFSEGSFMSITEDTGFTLHPIFEDMTDTELSWSSSAPDIAGVSETGHVTIHRTGSCIIKAVNRHHNIEASITLDIKLKAQGISIMFGNQDMVKVPLSSRFVSEQITLIIGLTPSYAYSDDIIYFSSNPEVAEFRNNVLHCISPGKSEIYVESAFNDIHYKFTVFVLDVNNG